jgi:hypothetical protein
MLTYGWTESDDAIDSFDDPDYGTSSWGTSEDEK